MRSSGTPTAVAASVSASTIALAPQAFTSVSDGSVHVAMSDCRFDERLDGLDIRSGGGAGDAGPPVRLLLSGGNGPCGGGGTDLPVTVTRAGL